MPLGHRFGLQMPLRQMKVLDVNTQVYGDAIAHFDPTPLMQKTPESEKQQAGLSRYRRGYAPAGRRDFRLDRR